MPFLVKVHFLPTELEIQLAHTPKFPLSKVMFFNQSNTHTAAGYKISITFKSYIKSLEKTVNISI